MALVFSDLPSFPFISPFETASFYFVQRFLSLPLTK
jgi:hypothetical protein